MSVYEGTITLTVRFAADNGFEADQALASIAQDMQGEWNDDLPRDDDGDFDEERVYAEASSLVVGWKASTATTTEEAA